jgi:hypothetical protein
MYMIKCCMTDLNSSKYATLSAVKFADIYAATLLEHLVKGRSSTALYMTHMRSEQCNVCIHILYIYIYIYLY